MPAAKTVATITMLPPTAAESSTVNQANRRVRLSKVLAARPTKKSANVTIPATQPRLDGAKSKKGKRLSNRYKISENEYEQLAGLKKRLLMLGISAKKSELLRAGIMLLAAADDTQLKKAVAKVELIETERPPRKTS